MSTTTTIDDVETDTESIRELTAFQRNILVVLAEEPTYGLDIKSQMEDYYDDDVNHGRLYPNLDQLVELGLVEKGEIDKRTNEYALTEAGYAAIRDQVEWTISKLLAGDVDPETIEDMIGRPE
jgi:DNA-binding PadR family transcriptional regulator